MAKIKVETSLKSRENELFYNCLGIKNNNVLQYKENDFSIKIDITDNCVKMLRKNSEYEQLFEFNEKISKCIITTCEKYVIDIPIITKKIVANELEISITYLIDKEEYIYTIKEV